MNDRRKDTLKLLGIFLLILLLGRFTLPIVNSPGFRLAVENAGVFGPVLIVLYVIASHVFAPIAGSPMLFVSASVFGLKYSTIYFYIGGLFSSAINFWIARKYGRMWVVRLAGKSAMSDIDNFVKVEGWGVLVVSRIFGFSLFDFISYAAGLTKMQFKKYYLITNSIAAGMSVVIYNVYKNVDLQTEEGVYIWLGSLTITALVFTFLIRDYLHRRVTKRPQTPRQKQ